MARQSSDKDDLMAEVVALSPRVALMLPGTSSEIIAGRRSDGRWSIFFGGDPVYHFDADNRLRRAFFAGHLYRSQGTTLARLSRQSNPTETVLLRHDLDTEELTTFLQNMRGELARLEKSLNSGNFTVQQSIPADANFLPELTSHLIHVLNSESLLAPALKK
jgi:hypothetical protein